MQMKTIKDIVYRNKKMEEKSKQIDSINLCEQTIQLYRSPDL